MSETISVFIISSSLEDELKELWTDEPTISKFNLLGKVLKYNFYTKRDFVKGFSESLG